MAFPQHNSLKKKNFLAIQGVKLHKEGKQLNGSERFAVDNMASEKDCRLLSDLVQVRLALFFPFCDPLKVTSSF